MRRKLKNWKNKAGHSNNGSPRQLLDEAIYREKHNNKNVHANAGGAVSPHYSTGFSGWSNSSRPRDSAVSIRSITPLS